VLWTEHAEGQEEMAYLLLQKAKSAMGGDKDRPIVDRHYEFPRTMFDARAYPKGGWTLHMLRRQLGDEAFFKCLKVHATEHRLKSVETSDFRHILERETGRDLERFFYDWTERPAHPLLDVTSEYQPDAKQLKVTVKQTQAGEAFVFPLAVRVVCPGDTAKDQVSRQTIATKETTFTIAVPSRPTLVEIDPEQALLAEIKETKGRDLWLAQLSAPAGVAARCRAADYFGKSKAPADREALAKALSTETFWGVQAEIATALGESGGDVSRDALLDGLKAKGPKVRRACAEHLSKFHGDAKAATALKDLLTKGDESYFVEAAALTAYGKLDQADLSTVLLPWLAKPSHNEVLRTAALEGLGNVSDLSSLDVLISWTKRGKSRTTRIAALRALGHLLQKHKSNEELQKKAVPALTACLEGETMNLQMGAINALRDAGRSANTALGALDALARHDPEDRVRDLAKKVAEQIRGTGATPADMAKLREELDKLKQANEALQQRLEKVERKGS
jgi:aminopeptidase N